MKNKAECLPPEHLAFVSLPIPHGRIADIDALKATFCAECNHAIPCDNCDIDYHFEHMAPVLIDPIDNNSRNNKRDTFSK